MNYDSPREIRAILETHQIALKKRWGQNFMVNRGAREKIADILEYSPFDTVWEIGPGLGAMTSIILGGARNVIAFEIDHGMIRALLSVLGECKNLAIIQGDAVSKFRGALAEHGMPSRILGNLPYSSASKIISTLVETGIRPGKMVFTVQKELGKRMCAKPSTVNYSSFSVFCQAYFDIKYSGDLKGGSFYPEPEVVSSIVALVPALSAPGPFSVENFSRIVRAGFLSRRKMLVKNLVSNAGLDEAGRERLFSFFSENNISDKARAEELDVKTWISLADCLICQG